MNTQEMIRARKAKRAKANETAYSLTFKSEKAKALQSLKRIEKAIKDYEQTAAWASVGDLQHYNYLLTQLTDSLYNEGECAE